MIIASIALTILTLLLVALAASTLYVATYAWWDPSARGLTSYPELDGESQHGFSLIIPCRHESLNVMRATLDQLISQNHPDFEVIISVGHDDPDTAENAQILAAEHPQLVRVVVDQSAVKNKPRQLNTALAYCTTKDVVGVFDAESLAAPDLLRNIDNSFRHSGADAVQGSVQLINYRDSWYALRNCLEYFIWFSSRLHLQARLGFIPLGGNTVFVKRELLQEIGGWDEECLAEDCELGVRLSSAQRRIVVAYSPALTTREETPDSVGAFVKQRTRWALGFMQVNAKGVWKSLPTLRERATAWWTLNQQSLMAVVAPILPLAVGLAVWARFPLPVTLFTFLPLIIVLLTLALEVCILREFGADHGFRIRAKDYAVLILGMPFYHVLLAVSAVRAFVKFRIGDFAWEKTAHQGKHLGYLPSAEAPPHPVDSETADPAATRA